jgi:hypothetical protein
MNDYYKKLGPKTELEDLEQVRFHIHEFWPNAEIQTPGAEVVNFIVETEAGTMLVGYAWQEDDKWFVRRAKSMNTTKWID